MVVVESEEHQKKIFAAIIKALDKGDIKRLRSILAGKADNPASGN